MNLQEKQQQSGSAKGGRSRAKRPLYRAVSDALRQRLVDGNLAAGSRLPALRELASEFSVSTITVRQALQTLEQEGRLHCIPGVGVFVRPTIPLRKATDQITIAFATIEIEVNFTAEIARSIEEACQARGWGMQLFNAQGDPHIEARNLSRVVKSGASGAIILPTSHPENLEALVQLKLNGFPFVLVDQAIAGLKVDVAESDHEGGAYLAAEHLLRHGHRRVYMVTQAPVLPSVAARIRGYEKALIDHGIEPLREWKLWMDEEVTTRGGCERKRWLGGCHAVLPLLKRRQFPVAVFAHNAYSGWGVFEACRELGLNVPRDVSIVCFDDGEFTRALTPPMTAIAQRTSELGRAAVELLERRLSTDNAGEPQLVRLPVDLIAGGSVASLGEGSRGL